MVGLFHTMSSTEVNRPLPPALADIESGIATDDETPVTVVGVVSLSTSDLEIIEREFGSGKGGHSREAPFDLFRDAISGASPISGSAQSGSSLPGAADLPVIKTDNP